MGLDKDSQFYKKAVQYIEEFLATGKKIEEMSTKDKAYRYIKNSRVYDENGELIKLEKLFELLGYPRAKKYSSDVRADLIKEINEYLEQGKSLHIDRKKLPFYERLLTYTHILRKRGSMLTHEQIMKEDLGFRQFSDTYFRAHKALKIKNYRDSEGYVDDYKSNQNLNAFVKDLAITYEVPYYFIVIFMCGEKLRRYNISVDRVAFVKRELENYAAEHNGTLQGLRWNDPELYNAFDYLMDYFSDGSEQRYTKQEWLEAFEFNVPNRFKETAKQGVKDIEDVIHRVKQQFPNGFVVAKDMDQRDYRQIVKKSISLGVTVSELLKKYGLNCKGSSMSRLTRTYVEQVPYIFDMKNRFNQLVLESGKTKENNTCEEEILEARVRAMKQVYAEFEEKLNNYLPERINEEVIENLVDDTIND